MQNNAVHTLPQAKHSCVQWSGPLSVSVREMINIYCADYRGIQTHGVDEMLSCKP